MRQRSPSVMTACSQACSGLKGWGVGLSMSSVSTAYTELLWPLRATQVWPGERRSRDSTGSQAGAVRSDSGCGSGADCAAVAAAGTSCGQRQQAAAATAAAAAPGSCWPIPTPTPAQRAPALERAVLGRAGSVQQAARIRGPGGHQHLSVTPAARHTQRHAALLHAFAHAQLPPVVSADAVDFAAGGAQARKLLAAGGLHKRH